MPEGLHITQSHEFDKLIHNGALNNPLCWEINALSLRTAAELLYKYEVSDLAVNKIYRDICSLKYQCLMLFAQMLENYLKCILAHKALLEKETMIGHELLCLSKIAGVHLDHEQSLFLSYISYYIVWRGRYPYPKRIKEYGVSLEEDYLPIHSYDFSGDAKRAIFLGDKFEDYIADFWKDKIPLSKQNIDIREGKKLPYMIEPYPFLREKIWIPRNYKVVIGAI